VRNPKPCPWCGRSDRLFACTFCEDGTAITCRCGARGPTTSYNPDTDRQAWRRWQRRKKASREK
jgi:hypothetical protein